MDEILKGMKLHVEEQFTTVHNYIDMETMILRKGSVSAQAGEQLLIPINMRTAPFVCGQRQRGLELFGAPRRRPPDEPGRRQTVVYGFGV